MPLQAEQDIDSENHTGVDDVLALLLALSARPDELELAMISVTYGNVSLQRYPPLVFFLPFLLRTR